MADDDDPWTTESDDSWYPPAQDAPAIEVDWEPPEPAGHLWYPDGSYSVVEQDRPPFGFGRWRYEQGEQMGLLDEARADRKGRGSKCAIGVTLGAMKPKERAEWEELLAADDITHAQVARAGKRHGVELPSTTSIGRHRNGECKCDS